jgi:DNA polymerase III alpha subunit
VKVSPHCHAESPLTGSTVANLIARAKELGRTHFAYTDHGHLSSVLKAYSLCKPAKKHKLEYMKRGLTFIPGIEIYFKDPSCPITNGTEVARCKYFTLTIHCQDQDAYQELVRIVSRTDMPTIEIYEQTQQLWSWPELERMASKNITVVLGGPHDIVGKAMLAGRADISEKTLLKLNTIFHNKLYVSLICEPWSKKYHSIVKIDYEDGTHDSMFTSDQVQTDKARKMPAGDLLSKRFHSRIEAKTVGGVFNLVGKDIKKVTLHKGFLPMPGGDFMTKVNRLLKALAKKHGIKILVSDYAYMANKEDKIVQTMRLEGNDKLQPNLYMKNEEEILAYLTTIMGIPLEEAQSYLKNNEEWAHSFDRVKLEYPWRLADSGGDALKICMEIIKKNGRMKWDDPTWVSRLREELNIICRNGVYDFTPYFLPIRDVLNHYLENGQLVGPGRGSAGGSLFCYLMGITQIVPFKYDLPFTRFFSKARVVSKKLPDVDVDLEDRELLVGSDGKSGYLYGRWGNKAAQISTRTTIRLKSAIKDTNRYFKGKVEDEIETFTESLPAPPQGVSDLGFVFGFEDDEGNQIEGLIDQNEQLQKYAQDRPEEWEIVSKSMGLVRAYSKHASAFVLSNVPISETLPTKEGYITQYEAKECESAGLIKYDFLVVKQLKDIRICLDLINKKNKEYRAPMSPDDVVGWWHPESDSGVCAKCQNVSETVENLDGQVDLVYRKEARPEHICGNHDCQILFKDVRTGNQVGWFTYQGKKTYIWDLPEEMAVFQAIWGGATETQFQINSRSMTPFVMNILPKNIMDLASILAVDRPGPIDYIIEEKGITMAAEYVERVKGNSTSDIPELLSILPNTYGTIIYQEDLGKIAKQLAGFSDEDAELLRENMAKKKKEELMNMKPLFIKGAAEKLSPEVAEKMWEMMVTFARYGFSIIHAVEYAMITYACMFLKYHYPLEWWAAILTNAEEKEITSQFWPYVKDMVLAPDINLSGDTMVVDYGSATIRSKLGIIRGIGEKTIEPIVSNRPYKDIQDFVDKDVAGPSLSHKLIHVGVLDSLFPSTANLIEKLKLFEEARELREYRDRVKEAQEKGKTVRATGPRQAQIPEDYQNLSPIKEAAMKKSVLTSLPIDLHSLGAKYSKVIMPYVNRPTVMSPRGFETLLINGAQLDRLEQVPGDQITKSVYVAATCYVVEAKEFAYAKNTKKALKVIMDVDGFVSEKVLWPDYNTGELMYPKELKKGTIATVFMRKKDGRKDMSIMGIVVEG